jgi:hypothetical protein
MYIAEDQQDRLVLKHFSWHWLAPLFVTVLLSGLGVLIDRNRARATLSCMRHETDPSYEVGDVELTEDIDCIMVQNDERSSFELETISLREHSRHRQRNHPQEHIPGAPGVTTREGHTTFELVLHQSYPVENTTLFRFHSRADAERSLGEIQEFLQVWKRAAMSCRSPNHTLHL